MIRYVHSDLLHFCRCSHKSQAEAISKSLGHSAVAVADPRVTNSDVDGYGLGWRLFNPLATSSAGAKLCLSTAGTAKFWEQVLVVPLAFALCVGAVSLRMITDGAAAEAIRALGLLLPSMNGHSSHDVGTSMCVL
jgi:hypothetical protein